jgi:hypothetical protein
VISAWGYGGFAAGACLLAAAGTLKLVRPDPTARALASVGLGVGGRTGLWLVRVASAAEVAVAAAALAHPDRILPALVAASYLGFAGFVALAWRRGGTVSSCGCFGEVDASPTVLHIILDLGAAAFAVAAATATRPYPGLWSVLAADPVPAAVWVVLVILSAYLAFLAMSVLPRTYPDSGPGAPS